MKLYHGTSELAWNAIKAAGAIQPRRVTKRNNWAHNEAPSHPHAVYLTDVYACYFAVSALEELPDGEFPRAAIIEVDVDKIIGGMVPDEDALEQSSRTGPVAKREMVQRTAAARGKLKGMAGTDAWRDSLAYMGTCAHMGPIPLEAITRVALVGLRDTMEHRKWTFRALDPTISAANYRFCAHDYRALTATAFEIGQVEDNFLKI